MKKALIVFGTTTGNTEDMAAMIARSLRESGLEAETRNVVQTAVEDLTSGYDLVMLGCPAYGDDSVELQDDFAEFVEKLEGRALTGLKVAVFAPGDSSYEHFCGSVDFLEEKIGQLGGVILIDGLKVDGAPGDASDEIADWAKSAAALFR
ncbi:MAG: flavodoxin [Pseudomonadota bacterium]